MKSVILEYVCDYVCVLLWYIKCDVIMFGGKYFLMLFGDLIIINVDESEVKDKIYYYIVVNVLIGEKYYSNLVKIFLKGNYCIV